MSWSWCLQTGKQTDTTENITSFAKKVKTYNKLYKCYIYTKILEVNLFAFAYRLFHEDFSSIDGTFFVYKSSPSSTLPLVTLENI